MSLVAEAVDRDPGLLQRVAVAQGDGVVLQRLAVDRHAPWGADLVLASVPLADRAALVELGRDTGVELVVDCAGLLRHALLGDEG